MGASANLGYRTHEGAAIIIDIKGRQPDPDKIKTVQDVPVPINTENYSPLYGFVNYYNQFMPKMLELLFTKFILAWYKYEKPSENQAYY